MTPGSPEKIKLLTERYSKGVPLFEDADAQFGHGFSDSDRAPESSWITDGFAFGREYEKALDAMIKARLNEVRGAVAVVVSAPCQTSNDKSQAGCGGGCEWCTEVKKARQRGKKIEGAGNRSGVHSQKFELV